MRALAIVSLLALGGIAQANDSLPAPPQSRPILLEGATLHTLAGAPIRGGFLLLDGGKIVAVSPTRPQLPPETETVDVSGRHVYPGLISPNSAVGLIEIPSVRGTVDTAETGPVNANVRAEVAVNPDSEVVPVTRANGILTVHAVPKVSSGGVIAGRSALIELDGWTWEEMTHTADVGLHVFWPPNRPSPFAPKQDEAEFQKTRMKQIKVIEDTFDRAAAYGAAREADPSLPLDLNLEALSAAVAGEQRVFLHANDLVEIEGALNLVSKHGLSAVLVGGYDAEKIASRLKSMNVPVIVAGVHRLPLRRFDPENAPFTLANRLRLAGLEFAISRSGSAFTSAHERNLPYEAAMAAAHGLPPEEALKAVTLYAARILGVEDRLGSLAEGKDATVIVTDGDPLEVTTNVVAAYIRGKRVDLTSRHTRLYEKYQQRYQQIDSTR